MPDSWDDRQKSRNLSCGLSTYGPGQAQLSYEAVQQDSSVDRLFYNAFESKIEFEEIEGKKLKGKFEGVEVTTGSCQNGFGWCLYENKSSSKLKVTINAGKKNIKLGKAEIDFSDSDATQKRWKSGDCHPAQ